LLFAQAEDLELVGALESGEAILAKMEQLRPEVVIMDVRLPGMDGISAVKRMAVIAPGVHSVMFTAYGDRRLLSDAIGAGARGYVLKASPPEDLLRAVRTVCDGRSFVDPSLSPTLLLANGLTESGLTEREREILQLLAGGLHTGEVAGRIGLSAETVKADTKRAIEKLDADSRVHAVAIALRQAMIE
jgi:DNA-binding NarL/FixJ family response regulator